MSAIYPARYAQGIDNPVSEALVKINEKKKKHANIEYTQ